MARLRLNADGMVDEWMEWIQAQKEEITVEAAERQFEGIAHEVKEVSATLHSESLESCSKLAHSTVHPSKEEMALKQ